MRHPSLRDFAIVIFLTLSTISPRAAAESEPLLVLDASGHEVLFLDRTSLDVLAQVATEPGPHQAAVSPDGSVAFISEYGGWVEDEKTGLFVLRPGHSVAVVSLRDRTLQARWDLGGNRLPNGIAVSRDGRRVWVTAEGDQAVLELDASTGRVLRRWRIAQHVTHELRVDADERRLYASNTASGTVSVIELGGGRVRTFPVGSGPEGMDISPDGRELWVALRGADEIAVVDTATDQVLARLPSGGAQPVTVRFEPLRARAWVANSGTGSVSTFDTGTRALERSISTGGTPRAVLVDHSGAAVYVACGSRLVVIDAGTATLSRALTIGRELLGLAQ